jgi:hypothetical protein
MVNPLHLWSLFLGSILVFLGIRYFFSKKINELSKKITRPLLIIHLLLTALFVLSLFLTLNGLSFRGYRSTSWIFLTMTIFGAFFFILRPNTINMKAILVFPFMWTILSIGLSALLISCVMIDYKCDLVYSDKKYRLERTGWFITPCKLPSLFIKRGVFEKHLEYINNYCLSKSQIDSIKIVEASKDSIYVSFYHHSDRKDIPNPIVAITLDK